MEMCFIKRYFNLRYCLRNAGCDTQARCHQIKVITVKGSKLTIRFYEIVVDLQEFLVMKVLFKAVSGRFISKLLFPVLI